MKTYHPGRKVPNRRQRRRAPRRKRGRPIRWRMNHLRWRIASVGGVTLIVMPVSPFWWDDRFGYRFFIQGGLFGFSGRRSAQRFKTVRAAQRAAEKLYRAKERR